VLQNRKKETLSALRERRVSFFLAGAGKKEKRK
jgi:hypothetical protein